MADDELKPCPFCGSPVVLWDTNFGVVKVIECKNCGVRFVFKWSNDNTDLKELWNKRAEVEGG